MTKESKQPEIEEKIMADQFFDAANARGIPIIDGSLGYSGGMVFDVSYESMITIISSRKSDSLIISDRPKITQDDIEFTKHLEDVDASFLVGMDKHINFYLRDGVTNTWFRSETKVGQIVLDLYTSYFEDKYDVSYEDFDDDEYSTYDDLDEDEIASFAKSIAINSSFGALKNRGQRDSYTSDVVTNSSEKEVDQYDINKISTLAQDLRELVFLPNRCKALKANGKNNKEIGEELGITPYKAGKYLNIESPKHLEKLLDEK